MKVLLLGRIGLLEVGGGDKVQIENTAKNLEIQGATVDIKTSLEFDPKNYDIVHVFQLDWTPETYFYAKRIKEAGVPFVLSPIHHSVEEVKYFDDTYAFGLRRVSKLLFKDQHDRDTFKNVYRSFFDRRKIWITLRSIFLGLRNMHTETLKMADVILVQTEKEAQDLSKTYGVDINWRKIPNGVGESFINPAKSKNPLDVENYILSVGRIEPRKNQINIIEAVSELREKQDKDISLVFIGSKNSRHLEYTFRFEWCLKKYPWVKHIERVPYEIMPSYYSHAKVCVSASWFETTGLTSLEALFCGANAVAAGERAKEYLGENASYCTPDDVKSIEEAITQEFLASPPKINDEMLREYTWKNAARKTLEVYKEILAR